MTRSFYRLLPLALALVFVCVSVDGADKLRLLLSLIHI